MHWLGTDRPGCRPGSPRLPFVHRVGRRILWHGNPPAGLPAENQPPRIRSRRALRGLPATPRAVRYQLARFCQWEAETGRNTATASHPNSLERARQQGLRTAHLISLLANHCAGPLPPVLLQALDRWEKFGTQATVEAVRLLRLGAPEMMTALRQTRAARHLGEPLNPTVVLLKPGGEEALLRALAELGYLGEGSNLE